MNLIILSYTLSRIQIITEKTVFNKLNYQACEFNDITFFHFKNKLTA